MAEKNIRPDLIVHSSDGGVIAHYVVSAFREAYAEVVAPEKSTMLDPGNDMRDMLVRLLDERQVVCIVGPEREIAHAVQNLTKQSLPASPCPVVVEGEKGNDWRKVAYSRSNKLLRGIHLE